MRTKFIFSAALLCVFFSCTISRRQQGSKRFQFNATACAYNEELNQTHQLEPAPLIRVISVSADNYSTLCTMLEFRAYMHVYYRTDENETECHTVPVEFKSAEHVVVNGEWSSSPVELINASLSPLDKERKHRDRSPETHPVVIRTVTTEPECCTKNIRCFSIPLASDTTGEDPLDGWRLNFTWVRTPESYETGEEGWSSVGAPIGSLSGVYDMVRVMLFYTPNFEVDSEKDTTRSQKEILAVKSDATERFQARVGDYFECASHTDLVLTGDNVTTLDNLSSNAPWNFTREMQYWAPGLKVILSMTGIRAQAFADVNVPEFTGASVVCVEDHPQDGTMSIVIGLSICALVILVLLGLAISHLKDRERSFEVLENTDKPPITAQTHSSTVF